jgi:DNA polymerase III subunit epsilon
MSNRFGKLLFVDLETTGPNPALDQITEIGIVEVSDTGVTRWSSLVNPGVPIPPFIQQLTGIDDDMVAQAPTFPELIEEVQGRLQGGLFIAHNARFDYGFLRQAFKRVGITLRCDVLCTVKLSRKLFPAELKHSLDTLVTRHGLLAQDRHRALADADLLWQFWRKLEATVSREAMDDAVAHQLHRPGLPSHLEPDVLDDLPDAPGVYIFHDENDRPLYIGRATQLRARILAHFHGDRFSHKDMLLARLARHLEWHETAGDIGARLLESRLLRTLKPEHNNPPPSRRIAYAWKQVGPGLQAEDFTVVSTDEVDFATTENLYGPFNSSGKAQAALKALADGMDGTSFSEAAIASLRLTPWPYDGPAGLVETGANGRQDVHVVDRWRYLGTARHEHEIRGIVDRSSGSHGIDGTHGTHDSNDGHTGFDADVYRMLTRALALRKLEVRALSPRTTKPAVWLASS